MRPLETGQNRPFNVCNRSARDVQRHAGLKEVSPARRRRMMVAGRTS